MIPSPDPIRRPPAPRLKPPRDDRDLQGRLQHPGGLPRPDEAAIGAQITDVLNPWFVDVSRGRFIGYSRGTTHQYVPLQPQAQLCSDDWLNEVTTLADAAERKWAPTPTATTPSSTTSGTSRIRCNWAGRADLPEDGNRVILNGNISLRTLAHEFGHHLGLGHAGTQSCTDNFHNPVPLYRPLESQLHPARVRQPSTARWEADDPDARSRGATPPLSWPAGLERRCTDAIRRATRR